MFKFTNNLFPLQILSVLERLTPSFSFFIPNPLQNLQYTGQSVYTTNLYNGPRALFFQNFGILLRFRCLFFDSTKALKGM